MSFLRALGTLASFLISLTLALLAGEIALRWLDHQPLLVMRLPPLATAPAASGSALNANVGGPLPADIDPAWIDAEPPPYPRPPIDARLEKLARTMHQPSVKTFELFRVWNRALVRLLGCHPGSIFPDLPQPILVFDAPNGGPLPSHRYLPGRTLPGGLATNRFGWRGADVVLDKPPGTIRLAFVGASTTVGLWGIPFSYPEYVLHWLNLWAQRAGLTVRFDGINGGREGLSSGGIVAVATDEVLPLEPDAVVYYEGANQSLCVHPLPRPPLPPHGATRQRIGVFVHAGLPYLESARRAEQLLLRYDAHDGAEPAKPPMAHDWFPAGIDDATPDLSSPLPSAESAILHDLEQLRTRLAADGSELFLSSFVWLVHEGLRLDPILYGNIYRMLNEQCWPFTYRDLRRAADLHNRIMERYATDTGVPFLDVAAAFPEDPALYFDAVHLSSEGTKVQAWLTFRALVPLVRARIESGAWPRPDRSPLSEHPNIKPGQPYEVKCAQPTVAVARPTPTPRSDGFM